MRFLSLAAGAGIAMLASAPLAAQTAEPAPTQAPGQAPSPAETPGQAAAPEPFRDPAGPSTSARYAFSRVDGGFLRFDSVTGQVAMCSERSGTGWACRAVPDERAALDSEIARLQGEVTQLKSEIAALRVPAVPPRPPADLVPRAEGDAPSGGLRLPTDEDIQRARAAIQKLWRQFVDMVADFQRDVQRKG